MYDVPRFYELLSGSFEFLVLLISKVQEQFRSPENEHLLLKNLGVSDDITLLRLGIIHPSKTETDQ